MNFNNYRVTDRKSFIEFLELFNEDLRTNKNQWENKTLEDFLEAMTTYSEDIQSYYDNMKNEIGEQVSADTPSWRVFADILRGARIYE
ncbi:MAG TPA: hypothetical protein VL443_00570 [Cyclobacteriaceae bacterium]|jgi:hypothetical protein|nr:hypothetical protein [Cyclobacteriaceae bacterium]